MRNRILYHSRQINIFKVFLLATAAIFITASCKGGGNLSALEKAEGSAAGDSSASQTYTILPEDSDPSLAEGGMFLTSSQAGALAYEKAKKWNPGAVLWYLQALPNSMHYDFANNGKASAWLIGFANPDDEKEYFVMLSNHGVIKTMVMNTRVTDILPDYPKSSPIVGLRQAIRVAVQNGAPKDLMPYNVEYKVDGAIGTFSGPYRPLWLFSYRYDLSSTSYDLHFYYVDGLTGQFIRKTVKTESGSVEDASTARVLPSDYNQYKTQIDNRCLILKHYTLIDEKNYDAALRTMASELVPDKTSEQNWTAAWSALKTLVVNGVDPSNQEHWTADSQVYVVNLTASLAPGAASDEWTDGENTRYITVRKTDGAWEIAGIRDVP